jgi:flavin reductase (DIM6/NTAB) family NADH-FMN oxidoreductase RutF
MSNAHKSLSSLIHCSAMYKLMTSGIVPRPVAFVSSLSKDGTPNLAPFRSVYTHSI